MADALAGRITDAASPEGLGQGIRRFTPAVLFLVVGTAIFVAAINEWTDPGNEHWFRICVGSFTAALFAVGGTLFTEERRLGFVSRTFWVWLIPLLALGSYEVRNGTVLSPWLLPLVGTFWASVGGFTKGWRRHRLDAEERFWTYNFRAVANGILIAAAGLVIALGLVAIERALAALFALDVSQPIYRLLLPVIATFVLPVIWLASLPPLPRPGERRPEDLLSRSVSFIGRFVTTPLLLAYALILHIYALQIVLAQGLPQGMLGWMVLGFTVSGAANLLVLYSVRTTGGPAGLFRRLWFWLTLVPLVLYALAVGERISTYGLTSERMFLIAGGIWAGLLTLLFLLRRGDLRLVPGLAGLVLLAVSLGPWNYQNLPLLQQAARLDALLTSAGVTAPEDIPNWADGERAAARGAIEELSQSQPGLVALGDVFARHGLAYDETFYVGDALDALGANSRESPQTSAYQPLWRSLGDAPVDLSPTPVVVGLFDTSGSQAPGGIRFSVNIFTLTAGRGGESTSIDLGWWAVRQAGPTLSQPIIRFKLGEHDHALLIQQAGVTETETGARYILSLSGLLLASKPSWRDPAAPVR